VDLVLELTGSSLSPQQLPQEQSFVTHRTGSTEKAARMLGFRARASLREGLRRVAEWRTGAALGQPLASGS